MKSGSKIKIFNTLLLTIVATLLIVAISFHSQLSNFIKEIYDNNYPIDKFITLKGN